MRSFFRKCLLGGFPIGLVIILVLAHAPLSVPHSPATAIRRPVAAYSVSDWPTRSQEAVNTTVAEEADAYEASQIAALEAEQAQALADQLAAALAESTTRLQTAQVPVQTAVAPSGNFDLSQAPCGGGYPPCWVAERESHGDYNAFNPTGCYSNGRSGCYGKWQFGWFWGGKLGLPDDPATATPAQQDAAAMELWNGGAGCSNWAAC